MSAVAPRFSIVVPHYDRGVSDELLLRGMRSLAAQTFRNFEVLLYHDGPLSRPLPDLRFLGNRLRAVKIAATRFNDWGHSLRDMGIRDARGDYIVHFNADNLLYRTALAKVDAAARAPVLPVDDPSKLDNPEIVVFAILMRGLQSNGRMWPWRDPRDTSRYLILTGIPPAPGWIDCLQAVISRKIWLEIGGWYDRSKSSDGAMYSKLIRERAARFVSEVLGERW